MTIGIFVNEISLTSGYFRFFSKFDQSIWLKNRCHDNSNCILKSAENDISSHC